MQKTQKLIASEIMFKSNVSKKVKVKLASIALPSRLVAVKRWHPFFGLYITL